MKFAVFVVLMVLMAGVMHVLFIFYDYVFMDSSDGAFVRMQSRFNDTWSVETQNRVQNMSAMLKQFFGIGRVVCIAMIPVAFVVMMTRKPKIE